MTPQQQQVVTKLQQLGYRCLYRRTTAYGALLYITTRKLTHGTMRLHVAADGTYKLYNPNVLFSEIRTKTA